jgi:hypothetical protein
VCGKIRFVILPQFLRRSFRMKNLIKVLAAITLIACGVWASDPERINLSAIEHGASCQEEKWEFSGNTLTVKNNANIIVTGRVSNGRHIRVLGGTTADITFENLSITGLGSGRPPFLLEGGANVTLDLAGENILEAGSGSAGIQTTGAELTIEGDGALTVSGGSNGAGVGGNEGSDYGNIIIRSGTITAVGGSNSAGIGGGNTSTGGSVTINGGEVTANGSNGAGIGGGWGGNSGDITINNGTVAAKGGSNGAGIGGGDGGRGIITINGGIVTAIGGDNGAGIGGGNNSGGANSVTIRNAAVMASGGNNAAGIGGGKGSSGGSVAISGGFVRAEGCVDAHGIGAGSGSNSSGTFTMNLNAFVIASSIGDVSPNGKSSGILVNRDRNTTEFYGSSVTTQTNATIPEGYVLTVLEGQTLNILSGTTLTNNGIAINFDGTINYGGSDYGTWDGNEPIIVQLTADINLSEDSPLSIGIGWTFEDNIYLIENGANVTITGVSANQRRIEVAVDAEVNITLNDVTIEGLSGTQSPILINSNANVNITLIGVSTLTAGNNRAGIQVSDGTTLTIDGTGSLTARGGSNAAGIGGGNNGAGGIITINGGIITAIGGSNALGIGRGSNGAAGTFEMNGNAVVFASSLNNTNTNRGILFAGTDGRTYGNVTISANLTIPAAYTLIVAEDATLTIPAGITLSNNGTVTKLGVINHSGSYGVWAGNPYFVSSDDVINLNESNPTGGTNWTFSNNVFTISDGANITITGTSTNQRRIAVAGNATVNIMLNDVDVRSNNQSPFLLGNNANVTLALVGTNRFVAGTGHAGIRATGATLTINGTGSLTAIGGNDAAGIGGNNGDVGGNITINGGIITARSGNAWGQGIGSGYSNVGISAGTLAMNGNAVVFASTVGDISTERKTGGILFLDTDGIVYGETTIAQDITIPATNVLTVPTGASLKIPAGITLRNNGTIILCGMIIPDPDGVFVAGNTITNDNCGVSSIRDILRNDRNNGIKFTKNPASDKAEIFIVEKTIARVVIYDALGNVVFDSSETIWDLRNTAGRFVANGMYLVIVEAIDRNGKIQSYSAKLGVKR